MSLDGVAQGSHPFWESLITRHAISAIAWLWLVWDSVHLFPRECENIWKREPSTVKNIYVFTRCGGLIGQTVNFVWTAVLLSRPLIREEQCWVWFAYQCVVIQLLYSALQTVLMLRVYALYTCSLPTRLFLSTLWVSERVVMGYTGINSVFQFRYDSTCLVDRIPHSVYSMAAVVVFVQLIIWGMTLFKYYTIGSWSNPVMRLIIRDGGIVFTFLVAFYATVLPYSAYVYILTHSMFAIFISSLSSLGCRVILNIQSLKVEEPQPMGENGMGTWCLETNFDDLDDISTRLSRISYPGRSMS